MRAFKRIGLITAAISAVAFICVAGLPGNPAAAAAEKADAVKAASAQTGYQRLEGKWVRPDGGYILELKNIRNDGTMTAAYFNPRPIRVFRAEAANKDGTITVFVELRDVNYPGSTYKLQYDPATDRLKGNYFQAVQRQTFDIEFVRSR